MGTWTAVYKTSKIIDAELIKSMLGERGIDAVIMNKIDRSLNFGTATVMCQPADVAEAERIINLNTPLHE